MIKYNLKCENDHEFESWFSDSGEYDKLNEKNSRMYLLFVNKNYQVHYGSDDYRFKK